jgi:hypothetical protein
MRTPSSASTAARSSGPSFSRTTGWTPRSICAQGLASRVALTGRHRGVSEAFLRCCFLREPRRYEIASEDEDDQGARQAIDPGLTLSPRPIGLRRRMRGCRGHASGPQSPFRHPGVRKSRAVRRLEPAVRHGPLVGPGPDPSGTAPR